MNHNLHIKVFCDDCNEFSTVVVRNTEEMHELKCGCFSFILEVEWRIRKRAVEKELQKAKRTAEMRQLLIPVIIFVLGVLTIVYAVRYFL